MKTDSDLVYVEWLLKKAGYSSTRSEEYTINRITVNRYFYGCITWRIMHRCRLSTADISKTLSDKKKRLEQFTQSSLKTNAKKVEQIWKGQQSERYALLSFLLPPPPPPPPHLNLLMNLSPFLFSSFYFYKHTGNMHMALDVCFYWIIVNQYRI